MGIVPVTGRCKERTARARFHGFHSKADHSHFHWWETNSHSIFKCFRDHAADDHLCPIRSFRRKQCDSPGNRPGPRFRGQPSVVIPPGALVFSDPLDFDLPALSDLAVTIHLDAAPDGVTVHPAARATSYLLAGNSVAAADLPTAAHTDHWYFLNGVDVLAKNSAAAVVTLGDSITDGAKSTTNGNARWPDDLERRLHANPRTADIGVLNEGIGGNRLVHDGAGPNALARLDRDVLAQSGVRWLIVLEGINDLGTRATAASRNEQPATAQDLIAAYQQIILRAQAHNIRVYGATITPCGGECDADMETNRQAINNWIRTSHAFDAVIDFDMATRDPQNPSRFSAAADSGDHLHPGDAGYKMMGDQIDLKLFE